MAQSASLAFSLMNSDNNSTNSTSDEFFVSSSGEAAVTAPIFTLSQQIGWTVFLSINILVHSAADAFLIAKRNTKIGRRRFFLYFALCNLGTLFFLLDTYGQLWQPDYNFGLAWRWAYAFYVFGFPTMYIPIMLLNFRIITAHKNRYAFLNRKREGTAKIKPAVTKNKSSLKSSCYTKEQFKQDWWFIVRFFILLIPFFFVYGFFFYSYDVTYFALSVHLLYMLINMGAVVYLCTIRKLLKRYEIDVALQMFLVGILFIVYWVLDNLMWNVFFVLLSDSQSYGIIGYSCVKLAMAYLYLVPTLGLAIRDLVRARENLKQGKKAFEEEEEEDQEDKESSKKYCKELEEGTATKRVQQGASGNLASAKVDATGAEAGEKQIPVLTPAAAGASSVEITVTVDNGVTVPEQQQQQQQ